MMKTSLLGAVLAVLVGAGGASAAQAAPQPPVDNQWGVLVGCWQLLDESVADESDVTAEEVAGGTMPRRSRNTNRTQVCVEPGPTAREARFTTRVGGRTALEEMVTADGADHPMVDSECTGTKRSEWSTLGPRLFTRADISCGGQEVRKVSSLTMLTKGPTWVDIQLIDIAGRKNIRVRRYTRSTPDGAVKAPAPFAGETRWTTADVKEAAGKLTPETVQAALVELGEGFDLNGKKLVELDKAGVPDNIIDLMVALTYPAKFVVERPSASGGYYGSGGFIGGLSAAWPWVADAMFWPSYYSPFAYRYWGYFDPSYVPGSGYVVVGNPGGGGNGEPIASGTGRVVDGHGYTRVRNREADPVRSNFGHDGGGTNSTYSSGGGASSSGGSSGVSSGGYSSGGGGGDGGRTAVPRPPGGAN